ncbi:hypothetical protein ABZ943_39415, partial [Streptomyces rubiginosohelvolus]
FAYMYLYKRGFLDGRAGFDFALAMSFYRWQIGPRRCGGTPGPGRTPDTVAGSGGRGREGAGYRFPGGRRRGRRSALPSPRAPGPVGRAARCAPR